MIHIFNRTELLVTSSLQDVNQIRSLLEEAKIEYQVKNNIPLGASSVRRGRPGNLPGSIPYPTSLYIIYVRRSDLEYAVHLIKNRI